MGANSPTKSRVAPSIILGFVTALVAMGLPMIGVSVNIYLGAVILALAFVLLAYGFWNWETAEQWSSTRKTSSLVGLGVFYFVLVGFQIFRQYKNDHPALISSAVGRNAKTTSAPAPDAKTQQPERQRQINTPQHSPTGGASKIKPKQRRDNKMSREASSVPAEVISAPNGIAIGGNAKVDNATVNNGPLPLKLTFTQESKPSQDVTHAYYKEVLVTPNVEWHPVSIAVYCSDEIKEINAYGYLIGSDSFVTDQSNKIGYVFVQDPAIAAGQSLTVGLFSDKPIEVLRVEIAPKSARKNAFMNPQ